MSSGDHGAGQPETLRSRAGRLFGAGLWLVFLGNPLSAVIDHDDALQRVVGLVALLVFVLVYLRGMSQVREIHVHGRYLQAWSYVSVLLSCFALTITPAGDQSLTCLVFVGAMGAALLPTPQAAAVIVTLFAAITVAGSTVDGWSAHGNNFALLLAASAVYSFRLAFQRAGRLAQAERDLGELAVQEERSRIARDLHDILGHSLTVIAVKAELAERMLDVDPARARAELEDLQRLSRDALADVRATASGIRAMSLPGEIASARMALESAGIEPDLPTVADDVDSRWRELFAWTLREGVTNVIRHSGATRCSVAIDADQIRIDDDGTGDGTDAPGSGLHGLRQRAAAQGATVSTSSRDGEGFSLVVRVPA